MGFFDKFKLSRLKEGLAKTRENLVGKVQKLLLGKSKIDDGIIDSLEEILLSADVGVGTTRRSSTVSGPASRRITTKAPSNLIRSCGKKSRICLRMEWQRTPIRSDCRPTTILTSSWL